MSKDTVYRTLNTEAKIIDAEKGIVEYVASDESLDAHREIVRVKGWKFNRFRKNAPFLNSHNQWSIDDLLGKVISAEVKDGQLVERVQWAIDVPENEMARLGFAMTQGGYLKAVSVGFIPVKQVWRDGSCWTEAVKDAGLSTEEAAMVRRIFLEQEQIELSSVVIGSNANALMKAYESGAVSEEQLVRCGFHGDDELDFLSKAATALDNPDCDAAFKAILDLEMKRIYQRRKTTFQGGDQPGPGAPTSKRAGVDASKQRDEERVKFLGKLDSLTSK